MVFVLEMAQAKTMLELRNVRKIYSGILAVSDISFSALGSEVTGFLGPNGSGKSTTIKMITGLIEPSEGEILFDGESIDQDPIQYRQHFGYVPEEPQVYPHLTSAEYLQMIGHLRGLPERRLTEKIGAFLHLFSLYEDRYVAMSAYSKGMRQKVLLAGALLHNPDLLLLDEPFSGLDVGSALILRDLVRKLAARGKTVLLSSHELDTIERVCSRVIILNKGRIAANDSIEQLRSLMSLPSLEQIFSQVALEQDTETVSRQIMELVES
jgi:ABC-2 type transport system ATP-binding protein